METDERIESAVDTLDNSGVDEPNEESGLTDLLTNSDAARGIVSID